MINLGLLEELVGYRFKSLKQIQDRMVELLNKKVVCIESESEALPDDDFMIDYEVEGDGNVYTLWYLKGRGENRYYITGV